MTDADILADVFGTVPEPEPIPEHKPKNLYRCRACGTVAQYPCALPDERTPCGKCGQKATLERRM